MPKTAARHRLAREAGQRVHQVAPLLDVFQADREVVVRDHGLRLLRERLEEVGGDGRARQSDQHLADPPQPAGETRGRLRSVRRHAGPQRPSMISRIRLKVRMRRRFASGMLSRSTGWVTVRP